MINIDELRKRVEDAEHRFGAIDERQKTYSSRLSAMIEAIDARQQDSETQLRESENALRRAKDENEQLRSLLHQLLMAIDGAGRDYLKNPVSELDGRLNALVAKGADSGVVKDEPADSSVAETTAAPAASETVSETVEDGGADAAPLPAASEEDATGASVREILQRMNAQIGNAEAS